MQIAILGRQPLLSLAELERVYGSTSVTPIAPEAAAVATERIDLDRLGGTVKTGRLLTEVAGGSFEKAAHAVIDHLYADLRGAEGKITLGISSYGFAGISSRQVQKIGLTVKGRLKKHGVSLRLVPSDGPALSSASSHHNRLGTAATKREILIIRTAAGSVIADGQGVQNISAFAARDQARPRRDPYVGMLPPKLARMMVNLCLGGALLPQSPSDRQPLNSPTVLDPFCGTGVVLQEAALLGCSVYGTDISEKMGEYTRENLAWLRKKYGLTSLVKVRVADATRAAWDGPVDAVISETYLGTPFSQAPSPSRLHDVMTACEALIEKTLTNLAGQLQAGTPLCLAVPAWRIEEGLVSLPIVSRLKAFGFTPVPLRHVQNDDLLYFREDQIVARQLLVLQKA